VVPMATLNYRLGRELVAGRQRVAFFGTGAVGYNPATTSVEFGIGPSFSWKSIALSALVDIGRDTKLAGGFYVGEKLGLSNVPKQPSTSTIWSIKPAVGLSVRIPLGGTGK